MIKEVVRQKALLGVKEVQWPRIISWCWSNYPQIGHEKVSVEAEICLPAHQMISGFWIQLVGISSSSSLVRMAVTGCHFSSRSLTTIHCFLPSSGHIVFAMRLASCLSETNWYWIFQNNSFISLFHYLPCYFSRAPGLWCQWEWSFTVITSQINHAFSL